MMNKNATKNRIKTSSTRHIDSDLWSSQQNNSKNWFFIKDIIFDSSIWSYHPERWQTNGKIHHYNQIVPFDCWWLKRQDVRFWHRLWFQTAFNQNICVELRVERIENDLMKWNKNMEKKMNINLLVYRIINDLFDFDHRH